MNKRGKIKFTIMGIILLITIFLIILINAEMSNSFDKEYDEETKTVIISDKITKQNIAKITLNTPINNYVMRG